MLSQPFWADLSAAGCPFLLRACAQTDRKYTPPNFLVRGSLWLLFDQTDQLAQEGWVTQDRTTPGGQQGLAPPPYASWDTAPLISRRAMEGRDLILPPQTVRAAEEQHAEQEFALSEPTGEHQHQLSHLTAPFPSSCLHLLSKTFHDHKRELK